MLKTLRAIVSSLSYDDINSIITQLPERRDISIDQFFTERIREKTTALDQLVFQTK